jgi:hypothetical protein
MLMVAACQCLWLPVSLARSARKAKAPAVAMASAPSTSRRAASRWRKAYNARTKAKPANHTPKHLLPRPTRQSGSASDTRATSTKSASEEPTKQSSSSSPTYKYASSTAKTAISYASSHSTPPAHTNPSHPPKLSTISRDTTPTRKDQAAKTYRTLNCRQRDLPYSSAYHFSTRLLYMSDTHISCDTSVTRPEMPPIPKNSPNSPAPVPFDPKDPMNSPFSLNLSTR